MAQKLLDYIISMANKSGAIPPAPNALKNLKQAIDGVPFELNIPGMSGIMNIQNIMNGLKMLQKQMGGLNNIGDFQQILAQVQNGTASLEQLQQALGQAGSLATVLMTYVEQGQQQSSNNASSGSKLNTQ